MKRRVFWSVFFTVSLRLQIYETIEAIFWQSASYVYFWMGRVSNGLKRVKVFITSVESSSLLCLI